jgi:hypothetical protein
MGVLMCMLVLGSMAQVQRKMPVLNDSAGVQLKNESLEENSAAPQNAMDREMLNPLNLSKEQRQKLKKNAPRL